MDGIAVVDLAQPTEDVAGELGRACREHGFFYVVGHGVDEELQARLERQSGEFFAQDVEAKLAISMARGGRAWRGYFPVGAELTSGAPDRKEGLYFGAELPADDPRVLAGLPLHGANLFPAHPAGLRATVLEYLAAMTALGHTVLAGIAASLGLDRDYFARRYTGDPLTLFRIFHYPRSVGAGWGVGEHTDYGLLTLLKQDDNGGLQVRSRSRWIEAVPVPGSFVCNIGDMLELLTGGLYKSTPHRVRSSPDSDRLSWPFFFDPSFDARLTPIPGTAPPRDDSARRWDGRTVHAVSGTYGDYLLSKVGKVFPELGADVLD